MTEIETDRFDDHDVPPSAKFILFVLDRKGGMTKRELVAETALHPSTVRRALSRLEDAGLVAGRPCVGDGRQTVYDTA